MPDYYDCSDNVEELEHQDADSALMAYVEYVAGETQTLRSVLEDLSPITIYEYTRMLGMSVLQTSLLSGRLAEDAAEAWNEEYGGPDGQCDMESDVVEELATAFEAALKVAYSKSKSWNCEVTGKVELTVEEAETRLRACAPEWFR